MRRVIAVAATGIVLLGKGYRVLAFDFQGFGVSQTKVSAEEAVPELTMPVLFVANENDGQYGADAEAMHRTAKASSDASSRSPRAAHTASTCWRRRATRRSATRSRRS